MLRRVQLGVALALGSVAGLTYWAGEQTEVAVLRTRDVDGSARETKPWVVDHEGTPWVRVANPRRGAIPVQLVPREPNGGHRMPNHTRAAKNASRV